MIPHFPIWNSIIISYPERHKLVFPRQLQKYLDALQVLVVTHFVLQPHRMRSWFCV